MVSSEVAKRWSSAASENADRLAAVAANSSNRVRRDVMRRLGVPRSETTNTKHTLKGLAMISKLLHPATLAAQALGWTDGSTGEVVLPVHTATTFVRDPDNQYRRGRGYGRADNPTYDQPQALLTALEGGAASLVFSSGMAAAAAVFQNLGRDTHGDYGPG